MDFREVLLRKINKPVAISIINCCEVMVGILVHVEDGFIQLVDLTGHIIDIPFSSITAVHEAQDTLGNAFGPCARFAFGPCGGPFGMNDGMGMYGDDPRNGYSNDMRRDPDRERFERERFDFDRDRERFDSDRKRRERFDFDFDYERRERERFGY